MKKVIRIFSFHFGNQQWIQGLLHFLCTFNTYSLRIYGELIQKKQLFLCVGDIFFDKTGWVDKEGPYIFIENNQLTKTALAHEHGQISIFYIKSFKLLPPIQPKNEQKQQAASKEHAYHITSVIFFYSNNQQYNVHQQTTAKGRGSATRIASNDQLLQILKKKRVGSGQYLLDIIREIELIQGEWQQMVKSLEDELARARKMGISVDDDEAYLRCCQLLEEEFQAEEEKFNKIRRKMKIGIQTAQQHLDICEGEKGEKRRQKQSIEEELQSLEIEIAKVNKRHRKQEQIRDEIGQEVRRIENGNVKLQELKQRSFQQKNLYLKVQEEEMLTLEEIARIQQEQQIYYDYKSRQEKYRQLTKILQKLHDKSSYSSQDIQSYLKEKINEMSVLRINLLSIDQKLEEFDVLLEEQNYIIQGLKYKSETFEAVDSSAFRKYQSKYEELYFNRNNNLDNWKNYKNYLEELLRRNKIRPHLKDQNDSKFYQREKVKSSYVRNESLRTQPNIFEIIEEEPSLSPSFKNIHTPQAKKMSQKLTQREPKSLKLPKLVRMRGQKGESLDVKEKLKSNIKRMIDQSDISLESVGSNQDNMSGEFIEVEFHKK